MSTAAEVAGAGVAGVIPEQDWAAAVAAIRALDGRASVLLVCHVNPDGDALGTMLGFGLGLRQLGLAPQATFPEPYTLTPPFDRLPGLDMLIPPGTAPAAPDLLVCFDAASEGRLG